jgi:hypothetical protein
MPRLAALCALLIAAGCGGVGNDPNAGHSQQAVVCASGDRRVCDCGGRTGSQGCTDDGQGFEPCICGVEVPDGGVPGAGDAPPAGCGVCDGCCRGTTCVPLANEHADACGRRGQACRACDAGDVCDTVTGSCAAPGTCNAATCPDGCCGTSGCVTATSWSQCGHGGEACGTCAFGGSVCEADGTCKDNLVDPNEYFYLSIRWVEVAPQTPSGGDWDPWLIGHTAPDPMVCLSYLDAGTGQRRTGCTQPCSDTDSCGFSVADGLLKYCYQQTTCTLCSSPKTVCDPVLFRGSALQQSAIDVTVYDYDPGNANDLIGEAPLPPLSNLDGATRSTNPFASVVQLQYDVLYALP